MVPSCKDTALISFIQFLKLLSCNIVTSSLRSNLHNRKMSISLKRKKIFQKEKRHSSVL